LVYRLLKLKKKRVEIKLLIQKLKKNVKKEKNIENLKPFQINSENGTKLILTIILLYYKTFRKNKYYFANKVDEYFKKMVQFYIFEYSTIKIPT